MPSSINRCLKLILTVAATISLGHASEIDFSQIPNCTYPACFPYHSSAIGCTSLTKKCFCNALEPINCAGKSCNGSNWYALEDWFDSQCGDPPLVNFDPLSQCSRTCVLNNIRPAYCNTTITRNCFCRLQSEIESFSPCIQNGCGVAADEALYEITKFYNDTCIHPPTIDDSSSSGSSQQTGDEIVNVPSSAGATPDTPESRLNEIIGLASGFGSLLLLAVSFGGWSYRKWRRSNAPGRPELDDLTDPPPRYTQRRYV